MWLLLLLVVMSWLLMLVSLLMLQQLLLCAALWMQGTAAAHHSRLTCPPGPRTAPEATAFGEAGCCFMYEQQQVGVNSPTACVAYDTAGGVTSRVWEAWWFAAAVAAAAWM
jgi:hypothetical protein